MAIAGLVGRRSYASFVSAYSSQFSFVSTAGRTISLFLNFACDRSNSPT
jgi:hypothetical protein